MLTLVALPYEVLSYIVGEISFDDVFNLGQTCKALKFFLTEERICKSVLQVRSMNTQRIPKDTCLSMMQSKLGNSPEALDAKGHRCSNATALRRVAKRRAALSTAQPFTVASIGLAEAYLYCKGVLCYTLDQSLRVLDLHHSGETEAVINIPRLVARAIPTIGENTRGQFQVLYYSDGIVSRLYKSFPSEEPAAWLIAFDVKLRAILVATNLDYINKLFVRHNQNFLYYGTHSETDTDGYGNWVTRGYDFTNKKWFPQKIKLSDIVGSDLNSTVCFELHNGYFYALSNQTSLEVEEIDWTSFYRCVRFPQASPERKNIEWTEDVNMWRRQHQEGPIDDRWTSLRLDTDDNSGDLKVIECRREWGPHSSRSRRTCYITDIDFRPQTRKDEYSPPSSSSAASSIASTAISPEPPMHDLSAFPNEPILRLLGPEDNPHHMLPRPRRPQYTHPESNPGQSAFTLTDSPVRYYDTSASAFLDLVNDPCPNIATTQRLRLRTASRKARPPSLHPSLSTTRSAPQGASSDLSIALKETYIDQPIRFWPPAQEQLHPNKEVDALYNLLNPPSYHGDVEGTADERSLVYATGRHGKPRALVFIGFDPAIKLAGLKRWTDIKNGVCQKDVGRGPQIGRSTTHNENFQAQVHDTDSADRLEEIKMNGKGKAQVNIGRSEIPSGVGELCDWATEEKAMYQDRSLGFYFGSDRNEKS